MILNIRKLTENAVLPTYGTEKSAGMDLYATSNVIINPGETVKVETGIAMAIPDGCVGLLFARSGLATKFGLRPANCVGVIDSDYRGEIIVALHNDSNNKYMISEHERVAQLVIVPFIHAELNEVGSLSETERGFGGFGSTGR